MTVAISLVERGASRAPLGGFPQALCILNRSGCDILCIFNYTLQDYKEIQYLGEANLFKGSKHIYNIVSVH